MFLFPLAGNSQPETDSLKQLLETALADSARIDILLSLSSSSAQDEALAYGREANQLAEQSGLKGRQALALKNIAVAYYRKGEYIRALEYYKQSIELYRASNDPGGISNILNNIGAIYNAQGDDAKALEYFLEALRYGEEAENELRIGTALLNVGVAYINKPQNYDQGIAALKRAVPAFEKIDYQLGIAVAYSNLGEVFLKKEEPDSALYYLEKSKEIVTDAGDDSWLAFTLNLIGKAYIQAGKYEQAIRTHEKAIQVAERKDSRLELGWATLGLANSYHANGNNALALRTYLKAESIFSEMGVKEGLKDVYKGLADTYESSSDYQDAYRYHQLYSNFKDTLYNVETADKVKNLTLNYELEKKEAEIEQLSIENKLQEAQIQKAQVLRNFFIALAAFILIVAAGIVVQLRITRKSNERKQALDRQTQINQQLQQIDRLKDQFLANTSHELRTPLNGIIGLADSLIDGVAGQLPKKAVDDLGMIASSGKRLAALVNDILDFSKLKDFNIELNRRPADLYALADIVMKINTPLIRGKDLQLLNTVPQELPAVDGDENRLQQILYNLIGNAIKFTESGYIKVDAVEIDGGGNAGQESPGSEDVTGHGCLHHAAHHVAGSAAASHARAVKHHEPCDKGCCIAFPRAVTEIGPPDLRHGAFCFGNATAQNARQESAANHRDCEDEAVVDGIGDVLGVAAAALVQIGVRACIAAFRLAVFHHHGRIYGIPQDAVENDKLGRNPNRLDQQYGGQKDQT